MGETHTFLLFDKLPYDIILGMDFAKKNKVTLDIGAKTMHIPAKGTVEMNLRDRRTG